MGSEENGERVDFETKGGKIKVLSVDRFGVCPRCGSRLVLFRNAVSAYSITEGAWINKVLAEKASYRVICPRCRFEAPMEVTDFGLYPKEYKMHPADGRKAILSNDEWRRIGYVSEESNNQG
jgi:hypothetical protein